MVFDDELEMIVEEVELLPSNWSSQMIIEVASLDEEEPEPYN